MVKEIIDKEIIARLKQMLEDANRIVVTCHRSPDGDAMGSSLALKHILINADKHVDIITPDMPPKSLTFMPGVNRIFHFSTSEQISRDLISRADLIFCLDFNTPSRLDRMGEYIASARAHKVMIDHHINPSDFCDITISFPELSSTSELVYRTVCELGWHHYITREAAQCFYVGMMTDTGNFTFSSEYPEIYLIVADLLTYNINKVHLYDCAMNTFSEAAVRLQGYALSQKMELFPDVQVARIVLTADELTQFGYKKGDTEGLVNKPLAIPQVTMSFFFRQDADCIKVSTRSQGDRSVEEICHRFFNGGGHKNASGGEFYGSLEQVDEIFNTILDYLKQEKI